MTRSVAAVALDESEEDARRTEPWLRPVFFGEPIPPHSALVPLPDQSRVGSTDVTRDERTKRR